MVLNSVWVKSYGLKTKLNNLGQAQVKLRLRSGQSRITTLQVITVVKDKAAIGYIELDFRMKSVLQCQMNKVFI